MVPRICVITGASRGIGLATALRFARAGWGVVIAARHEAELRAAADQVGALGAACEALAVDVGSEAGARELIEVARRRFERVDVLVNNAGYAPRAELERFTTQEFEQAIAVNVAAVFLTTRAVWPLLKAQGAGTIVNVSSLASVEPFPGFSVYGACKAWVNLFTQATAAEGRPLGIRVFAVAPGAVETAMLRENFPQFPRERTLEPYEVAAVIEQVCSAPLACASGQTIIIRR